MPSPPELRYVAGEIRIIEVPHQFDAEEFGCTNSNVGITGEITVNLEGKKNSS